MTGYVAGRLEEIEELTDGRCPYRPIRHHFGITAFGINAFTAHAAGDRILNEHDEAEDNAQEELYLVLEGHAEFTVGGESVDGPAGTIVRVTPGVTRTAFARVAPTTILALGGTPGQVYRPSGWELWGPLRPLCEEGRYAEAADRGRALLADAPPYSALYYNTACCECLAGRTQDALGHLRRAIELDAAARAYARQDSDLDGLRNEPEFRQLIQ